MLMRARTIVMAAVLATFAAGVARSAEWFYDYWAQLPKQIREAYQVGDWAATLGLAQPLAEKGNAQSQTVMGLLSYYGVGVPQDYVEAAKWYALAAAQGEHVAQSNLGDMYNNGLGVSEDHDRALELWRSAADKGHTIAMTNIGLSYAEGNGVEADICQAYVWWRKSAALGGGIAQFNIATMFERGDGVPADDFQAFIWADLAVDHMEPGAESQYEGALAQRASLMEILDPNQLKLAEQSMRENSVTALEALLPSCVR